MPFTQTPQLDLYYEIAGSGAPVLFIGGTGGDLRQKPNVLDGPLPKARLTIAYDQRGLGRSGKPPGPYTMAQYADDAAALLDALGHERVDVVGVSFGGMVAQHLALRHGERIRRLVLCCTSPGGSLASYPFHTLPDDLDAVERARMLMGLNDLRFDASWQAQNPERVEKMLDWLKKGGAAAPETAEAKRGARLQLEARADHDVLARLGGIRHPTLVCAGRYDGIAPAENQEALLAGLPQAELRWYEGGHMFLVQDRTAWTDIIAFLGAGPGTGVLALGR